MSDYHHRSIRMTDELWARLHRAYYAAAQVSPEPLSKSEWLERVLEAGMQVHTPVRSLDPVELPPSPAATAPVAPPSPAPSPPLAPPRSRAAQSREERRARALEAVARRSAPLLRPPAIRSAVPEPESVLRSVETATEETTV
jgi:hypothetical protein